MKTQIYSKLVCIGLFLIPFLSFSQTDASQEKINGYCDHIVVTVPGIYFDSLIHIINTNFPKSTLVLPNNTKAFLIPEVTAPYVEFWNSSNSLYTGSQIAFSSVEKNAATKAQSYYGYKGDSFGELFTVGEENSCGHPYGGNFFVSYGKTDISNPNDSIEVHRLKEIRTLLPANKSSVVDDYRFFNLDVKKNDSTFTSKDTNQTIIDSKLIKSNVIGNSIGHVSFTFELTKMIYNYYKEINLGPNIQFIYDEKSFTLILMKNEYDKW